MFCPSINADCVGEKCRDWDKEKGQCKVTIRDEREAQLQQLFNDYAKAYENLAEGYRYNTLVNKLVIASTMRDPTLDQRAKEVIDEAIRQPSAELAEKLLKNAGLID